MKKFLLSIGKALLYGLLFFVIQLIAVLLLSLIGGLFGALSGFLSFGFGAAEAWLSANLVSLATIVTCVVLLLFLAIFFLARGKSFAREVGFHRVFHPLRSLANPFTCGFGFCILATFAISVIPFPDSVTAVYEQYAGQLTGGSTVLTVLATVLVAPLSEEILFRGLVYTRLKKGMPTFLAALLSAILFGAMHGTLLHLVFTVPMGLMLCLFYEKYNSVLAAVALHTGFNLCGTVLSYYPTTRPAVVIALIVIGLYLTVEGLIGIAWYRGAVRARASEP